MLVVKVRQMSPLYQIKLLLNLVQIATDYSVYTGLDVCKKSCKYLWSFSRYSGKCRVAPFLLDHPVVTCHIGATVVVACHFGAMIVVVCISKQL